MAQYDHGTISPAISGTALAVALSQSNAAKLSGHSGSARPSYATAGLEWVKVVSSTVEETYLFDGTQDVLLWTINPTTHKVVFAGALSAAKNLADLPDKAAARGNLALATVAASGAYGDLSGKPTLATVAASGAYGDLSGKPALGTAAAKNFGTAAGQLVELLAGGKLPAVDGSQLGGLVFSHLYASGEQAIVAGGLITLAHGLPTAPKLVIVKLVCKISENGYAVGDVILYSSSFVVSSNQGITIRTDASNIKIRVGNYSANPILVLTEAGVLATTTPANWRLLVEAYA